LEGSLRIGFSQVSQPLLQPQRIQLMDRKDADAALRASRMTDKPFAAAPRDIGQSSIDNLDQFLITSQQFRGRHVPKHTPSPDVQRDLSWLNLLSRLRIGLKARGAGSYIVFITTVIYHADVIPLRIECSHTTPMKNCAAVPSLVFVFVAILTFSTNYAPAQERSEGSRKVVTRVVPQYPGLARPLHLQGSVRADVLVASNGKVMSVEVKGGHPLLAQAAQDAVRQWTWEPASHQTHESVELSFMP